VFIVLAIYLLSSTSPQELKQRLAVVSLYICIILALFIPFLHAGLLFIQGLVSQEFGSEVRGVSLLLILPGYLVKALPILLMILGIILLKGRNFDLTIPFLAGLGILMNTYPNLAYEYNFPALLAFIPFMIYWSRLPDNPLGLSHLYIYFFYVFAIAASFSILIFGTELNLLVLYLSFASFFLILPIASKRLTGHSTSTSVSPG
jgi:hypothetical protein